MARRRDIAPDNLTTERADYGELVLAQRLRDALARLNPELSVEALEDAFRKLARLKGAAASEDAMIWTAFQQLQTYKAEVPALFATSAVLVASDGVEARAGTLTAGREWFKPWRTISGEALADARRTGCQEART